MGYNFIYNDKDDLYILRHFYGLIQYRVNVRSFGFSKTRHSFETFFICSDIRFSFYHRFTKWHLAKVIYPRDKILQ